MVKVKWKLFRRSRVTVSMDADHFTALAEMLSAISPAMTLPGELYFAATGVRHAVLYFADQESL